MTTSAEYIESQLANRATASTSSHRVEHNRYYYELSFDDRIGWDWLEEQVAKASSDTQTQLELWKIDFNEGSVSVREVVPRESIDESQHNLTDFEP